MHQLGLDGMQRRIPDYAADTGYETLNLVATIGAFVLALSILMFLINFVRTLRGGDPAPADPWKGYTLEWWTSSPPPHHNFASLPPIRSERPVFDARRKGEDDV
jgi:cytochrome c oxidase subunit 1